MSNEDLVKNIKAGVEVTENMAALYKQNKGLIRQIARSFRRPDDVEDLEQEGFIGMCRAVDAWDPERGILFFDYAGYWIRQSMLRYLENCGGCIRIPSYRRAQILKYRRIREQILKDQGREPMDSEFCDGLGVSMETLRQIKKDLAKLNTESLYIPLSEDGYTLEEVIPAPDNQYSPVLDSVWQEELRKVIWPEVDALGEQQSRAIRARYQEGKTLKEAGKDLGCSGNYVRILEKEALKRLCYSKALRRFADDEALRGRGMKGTGVQTFRNTWTSATEREAIRRVSPPHL